MPRAQRLAFSLILLGVLGMLALAFWRQQPIPGQFYCMPQTLTQPSGSVEIPPGSGCWQVVDEDAR